MTYDYPWYIVVEKDQPLEQGDFLNDCSVVHPKTTKLAKEITGDVTQYDVIVMSQSCDILAGKIDLVLVCPVWSLKEIEQNDSIIKKDIGKEALRRGYFVGNMLLNKSDIEGFIKDYMVVDFKSVYSVPFDYIIDLTKNQGKRLRLLPPYREHLSQAFAKFFMRVGLPVDIPKFAETVF